MVFSTALGLGLNMQFDFCICIFEQLNVIFPRHKYCTGMCASTNDSTNERSKRNSYCYFSSDYISFYYFIFIFSVSISTLIQVLVI